MHHHVVFATPDGHYHLGEELHIRGTKKPGVSVDGEPIFNEAEALTRAKNLGSPAQRYGRSATGIVRGRGIKRR
jgi:hypothetical protein